MSSILTLTEQPEFMKSAPVAPNPSSDPSLEPIFSPAMAARVGALSDPLRTIINDLTQQQMAEPIPSQEAGTSIGVKLEGETMQEEVASHAAWMQRLREETFLGHYTISALKEAITAQFEDYINLEDETDYVDLFYQQMDFSMKVLRDQETHLQERREILNEILEDFVDFMAQLLEQRLSITIRVLEDNDPDRGEAEYYIRKLYEFFILHAKDNFKSAVVSDIIGSLQIKADQEDLIYEILKDLIAGYSPIITTMTPVQFLQYCNASEILEFYREGDVIGNFLRKYSMKLYQNDIYEAQLINEIILAMDVKDMVATPVAPAQENEGGT